MQKIINSKTAKYQPTQTENMVLDDEPTEGSFNGITSDAVAKVAGDVGSIEEKIPSDASSSNKLVTESGMEDALSNIGTGYTPKGNATVATLEAITGQSNGDMYIVTDSGTLNDGALAVSAGDSVAWDSTNEIWYKTNQYATQQEHDALTTYAQNVAHSIAPEFDPTKPNDAGGYAYYAGTSVMYNGSNYVFTSNKKSGDWNPAVVEKKSLSLVIGTLNFVTPEMFGAVGDGVTDDTEAIKTCVAHGGIIVFRKATYLVDVSHFDSETRKSDNFTYSTLLGIRIPSNTKLYGCGATIKLKDTELGRSCIMFCSDNYRSASYEEDIPDLENICIYDFIIDGNVDNLGNDYSTTGIGLYKVVNSEIRNVKIKNLCGTDGSGYGVIFAYCDNGIYANGSIDRSSRSNIYCWESRRIKCLNLDLSGSFYRDCATCGSNATLAYQKSEIVFENCKMNHEYSSGTHIVRFSGSVEALLSCCELYGNDEIDGISIPRGGNHTVDLSIQNCNVKNCKIALDATGQNTKTRIYACNSYFEGESALDISDTEELVLVNNVFKTLDSTKYSTIIADIAQIRDNVFEDLEHLTTTIKETCEFVGNILKNFSTNSYWMISSGTGAYMIALNRASEPSKIARIYSTGKAICNMLKMDSSTLTVNEYNI